MLSVPVLPFRGAVAVCSGKLGVGYTNLDQEAYFAFLFRNCIEREIRPSLLCSLDFPDEPSILPRLLWPDQA